MPFILHFIVSVLTPPLVLRAFILYKWAIKHHLLGFWNFLLVARLRSWKRWIMLNVNHKDNCILQKIAFNE